MPDMYYLLAGIFQAVPDAIESVWNFFYAGKLFMVFLLALSLLSIGVIIYKLLDLRRHLILPERAVRAIEAVPVPLGRRDASGLAGELRASRSVLGRLGLVALSDGHADRNDATRAVEGRAREEIVKLESGIALLEVVITIAPLLGLLGTVSGLVNVFSNLGDSADHSAIAIGIAEALNTTIAGLAIAVPTVVAHSFFMKKIERMGVRMEILLGGLLAAAFRDPSPAGSSQAAARVAGAEAGGIAAQPTPAPEVFTAIPDPGAGAYPPQDTQGAEPAPDLARAQDPPLRAEGGGAPPGDPALAPEGSFPRLLAGHRPEPAAPASPERSGSTPDAEQASS